MQRIVDEYADVVLQRRSRDVHVLEEVTATISAWHGNSMVASLEGYSSLQPALSRTRHFEEAFSLTPASSMFLRVEERVVRRWRPVRSVDSGHGATYESDDARPRKKSGIRHVWDSRTGPIPQEGRDAWFEIENWVGLGAYDIPDPVLTATFLDVEAVLERPASLLTGIGLGRTVVRETNVVRCPPPDRIRDRAGVESFAKVTLRGTCPILVPPDADEAAVSSFLGRVNLVSLIEWETLRAFVGERRQPVLWTGEPAAAHSWHAHRPGSLIR